MKKNLLIFWSQTKGSMRDLAPIVLVIAFFELAVLRQVPEGLFGILIGVIRKALDLTLPKLIKNMKRLVAIGIKQTTKVADSRHIPISNLCSVFQRKSWVRHVQADCLGEFLGAVKDLQVCNARRG